MQVGTGRAARSGPPARCDRRRARAAPARRAAPSCARRPSAGRRRARARPGCRSRECRCPRRRPRPSAAANTGRADRRGQVDPFVRAPVARPERRAHDVRPVASGQRSAPARDCERLRRRHPRRAAPAPAGWPGDASTKISFPGARRRRAARPLISRMSSAGTPARAGDRRPASRPARPRTSAPAGLSGCSGARDRQWHPSRPRVDERGQRRDEPRACTPGRRLRRRQRRSGPGGRRSGSGCHRR